MPSFENAAAVERLQRAFEEIISETPQGGAALSIWQHEKPLVSLQGGEASPGRSWKKTTPCLIWSAGKGVAAACLLHALQEKEIPLKTPVAELWPEFASQGKNAISLSDLLSHQAGLAAIDRKGLQITDHEGVAQALASQPPNWKPDGSHGYGARTFGFLLDEMVRRLTKESLASYWNRVFRAPLSLDLYFGLPENLLQEAAMVIAPKTPPSSTAFSKAFADPDSLTRRALSEPGGLLTPSVMNTPELRMASIPSLGAIATADALASFYALLARSSTFFREETLSLMQNTLSKGADRTLLEKTSFSTGFMTNSFQTYGPGKHSFGHPGAGGALGFSDPELGIGFAFIPSAMNPGALPGPRTQKLVRALYGMTEPE